MPKSRPLLILVALLVLTNVITLVLGAFFLLDSGVSTTHMAQSLADHEEALAQCLAVAQVAARPGADATAILDAAKQNARGEAEFFVKEGLQWVGGVGLAFDDEGRLTDLRKSWSP